MIRFGMALMEMIEQLTKGFIKATGRQPDNLEKLKIQQEAVQRFKEMNKVVDMQGRTLDPSKPIMGGTQEGAALKSGIMKATGAKPMEAGKKMLDDAIDNVSPGFSGDTKIDAELVAEDLAERMGKVYDDLPTKERLKIYDQAFQGLTKKRFDEDFAQGGRAGYMNGTLPIKKDGFFVSPDFSKMTPEERELYKLQMEKMKKGFEKKLSPEGLEKLKIQQQIREQQRKDMGLPEKIQLMAQGGRAGFKNGMSRRKFMQIMGGLAAIPIVGKFFKAGKVATKAAPIVKTPPVPGKPKWFDALVNKVISEGDDVTKQLATKEREIVHTVKLTDEPKVGYVSAQNDQVTVYRDLDDGTVRVEYSSVDNMSEAPVNLTFKPGVADETTKVKPAGTFQADEIVPESRMVGPDDFEIEEAVDEFDNVVDLNSDVSKLKEFAGEKLTTKEIVEGINKRKRSAAITEDSGEAADFMTSRQGDYDPSGDFASGGIARMLGE